MLLHPLPVGGYRRWQGREDPLFADLLGEAEGLEVIEEVLLDPGEGEYDSATGEFGPDGLNGLQCGEVDLDDGFGVEDEPAGRPGALVGCGQGRRRKSCALAKNNGASYRYITSPGISSACG
jgi:hypothetical protein